MTVKEFHEMSTATRERYINRETGERFTLDYASEVCTIQFRDAFAEYKKVQEREVKSCWPLVGHNGEAILVIEF